MEKFKWTNLETEEGEQWSLWCSCEHDVLGFVVKETNKDTGKITYRPLDSNGNHLGAVRYTFPWDAAVVLEDNVIAALRSSRPLALIGQAQELGMVR